MTGDQVFAACLASISQGHLGLPDSKGGLAFDENKDDIGIC